MVARSSVKPTAVAITEAHATSVMAVDSSKSLRSWMDDSTADTSPVTAAASRSALESSFCAHLRRAGVTRWVQNAQRVSHQQARQAYKLWQ